MLPGDVSHGDILGEYKMIVKNFIKTPDLAGRSLELNS
jgi:hypothetical protein